MDYRGVLFDMDGVLLDSETAFLSNLQRLLNRYGAPRTPDQLMHYVGLNAISICQGVREEFGFSQSPEEILQALQEQQGNFYRDTPELELTPGVEDLLKLLEKRGIPIGLASSTSVLGIATAMNRFRLLRYFHTIVGRDMVTNNKPHPECYQLAAENLGLFPQECVVVEDSPHGIQAGKRSGAYVVAFRGGSLVQDTAAADTQVDTYPELARLLGLS